MKLLILNSRLDAQHHLIFRLKELGHIVLVPQSGPEAQELLALHAAGLDLAIIHKESPAGNETGLEVVKYIKSTPGLKDLPLVITSEVWGDQEFAQHQKTEQGANGYLSFPFDDSQMIELIEAILGTSKESLTQNNTPKNNESLMVLEDRNEVTKSSSGGLTKSGATLGSVHLDLTAIVDSTEFEKSAPNIELESPDESLYAAESIDLNSITPDAALTELEAMPSHIAGAQVQNVPQNEPVIQEAPPLVNPAISNSSSESLPAGLEYLARPGGLISYFNQPPPAPIQFGVPYGDAVVPGGEAQSPDLEIVKKYLHLREQDVAALSAKLSAMALQKKRADDLLQFERVKSAELSAMIETQKNRLSELETQNLEKENAYKIQIEDLRFETKVKSDLAKGLEKKIKEATDEIDKLKERVRLDIRKIRQREKDLENRLEITKRDSEAILAARESKIVELKRKMDTLEFNYDLLQDQLSREKQKALELEQRLAKASQMVKVAEGLLSPKVIAEAVEPQINLDLKREAS